MRELPDPSSYWSENEGRRVVEAWRRSGETVSAFARRHGLRGKRVMYWSQRFATSAAAPAPPRLTFVPAAVTSAEVGAVIRATNGVVIELTGATPEQIAAITNALETRPA